MIAPSQGIHLVFDTAFLAGESAIMVPHTSDGRVLFAIPWHGHTLVGTTDTPIQAADARARGYGRGNRLHPLDRRPVLGESAHAGRRAQRICGDSAAGAGFKRASNTASTATLSRDHVIHIDRSGLVSIMGGKWTTYRHMAEDCVDQAATLAQLPERPCVTHHLHIHGFHSAARQLGRSLGLRFGRVRNSQAG